MRLLCGFGCWFAFVGIGCCRLDCILLVWRWFWVAVAGGWFECCGFGC